MSHLSLPRIHFRGDFCTNVATANNNDVAEVVDVAKVIVDTQGKSDEDFRQWLKEPDPEHGVRIRAGWNYYGDDGCSFQDVKVTCIELPNRVITNDTEDPLIGLDVLLEQAVMVDLDPQGQLGTQIFCGQFTVQKGEEQLLFGGPPTRFYSRWLTFQRNLGVGGFTGASAVWQAAIRHDQLTFGSANSPALEALQAAAAVGNGLVVRFCTYLVAPGIDQDDLAQRFANGEEVENPASGRVLGTIGPLQAQELSSVALGRLLHPSAQLVDDHTLYQLGPAVAQIDRDRHVVSVDLITAFPEQDKTLAKANVGPVSLRLHYEDENRDDTFTLGSVAYDQKAYEATAGVVDVPYSSDLEPFVDQGQLLLVDDNSGAALLSETDLMLETDDRACYLQEGDTQEVQLRVVEKGRAPQQEVTVSLEQYVTSKRKGLMLASLDTQVVEIPDQTSVGPDGSASLAVQAKRPGTCVIRFVAVEDDACMFNPATDFFTSVRVLPDDNYDHIPDGRLTFDFLYQEVLRYYHLIYPAMSPSRIDFSNEQRVRQRRSAAGIASRIAKDNWSKYWYMPRTRELSDGKCKLLQRWCQLQLQKP